MGGQSGQAHRRRPEHRLPATRPPTAERTGLSHSQPVRAPQPRWNRLSSFVEAGGEAVPAFVTERYLETLSGFGGIPENLPGTTFRIV